MLCFRIMFACLATVVISWSVASPVFSKQEVQNKGVQFDESFELWPVDLKINGQVMMAGSENLPEGTASHFLTMVKRRTLEGPLRVAQIALGQPVDGVRWPEQFEVESVSIETGQKIGTIDFKGVWLTHDGPLGADGLSHLKRLDEFLHAFIESGGILFADHEISPWLGQASFRLGDRFPGVADGINLVPDCIIGSRFKSSDERQMLSALSVFPRSVGIGIPPDGLVVLNGRKMRVYGQSPGVFLLGANQWEPVRRKLLQVAELGQRRINPYLQLLDLTAWRRDAIDRTMEPFPPALPPRPYVENGSLVIVGGGGMPEGLFEKFIEMAGGNKAKLVYIPCSESEKVPVSQRLLDRWLELGVASAVELHTKDRVAANSDETFLAPLREATGIWFGGGRQWNFSDSYYGTEAHRLMKQVVQRGGVIGGSSAGASIQSRYLARANPLGNFDIMVDGYERGGLGFIGGVAIDQHFSQRRRQKDMTSLVDRFPQLLGIGLDEKTAIIVHGTTAEVVGDGRAFFYDRNQSVFPGAPDYTALQRGDRYDLANREVLLRQQTEE